MQLHYVQLHDVPNFRVQKGSIIPNLYVYMVNEKPAGQYQGKNMWPVSLALKWPVEAGDMILEAAELVEGKSELLHYIGKSVSIVVLSCGKGEKYSWIRVERSPEQPAPPPPPPGQQPATQKSDPMLYLARDAMRWSVDLCTSGQIGYAEVAETAEMLAQQTLLLSDKLTQQA